MRLLFAAVFKQLASPNLHVFASGSTWQVFIDLLSPDCVEIDLRSADLPRRIKATLKIFEIMSARFYKLSIPNMVKYVSQSVTVRIPAQEIS